LPAARGVAAARRTAAAAAVTAAAIAVVTAAAARAAAAVQHVQFAAKGAQRDFGRVAVIAALVLPFAGLQLAFDIDLGAFFQVLLGHADQRFGIDRDRMPLGAFLALAGIAVLPGFRGGDAQVGDLAAAGKGADFGVLAQVADQDHLVHAACHAA